MSHAGGRGLGGAGGGTRSTPMLMAEGAVPYVSLPGAWLVRMHCAAAAECRKATHDASSTHRRQQASASVEDVGGCVWRPESEKLLRGCRSPHPSKGGGGLGGGGGRGGGGAGDGGGDGDGVQKPHARQWHQVHAHAAASSRHQLLHTACSESPSATPCVDSHRFGAGGGGGDSLCCFGVQPNRTSAATGPSRGRAQGATGDGSMRAERAGMAPDRAASRALAERNGDDERAGEGGGRDVYFSRASGGGGGTGGAGGGGGEGSGAHGGGGDG
eukprot:scaffold2104_cov120-Isochrysis_galbana.AAC.5